MRPKLIVLVFTCIAVASLILSCTPKSVIPVTGSEAEVIPSRVAMARDQALKYVAEHYNVSALATMAWNTCKDICMDHGNADYHAFLNQSQIISELQAQYAIDPSHSVYTTAQWTVIVNEPHDATAACKVTIINAEKNTVWSGMVDANGTVTEVKSYQE